MTTWSRFDSETIANVRHRWYLSSGGSPRRETGPGLDGGSRGDAADPLPVSHSWIDWEVVSGDWGDFHAAARLYNYGYKAQHAPFAPLGGVIRTGPDVWAAHAHILPASGESTVTFRLSGNTLSIATTIQAIGTLNYGEIKKYAMPLFAGDADQTRTSVATFSPAIEPASQADLLWCSIRPAAGRYPFDGLGPLSPDGYCVAIGFYVDESDSLRVYAHLASVQRAQFGQVDLPSYASAGACVTSFDAAADWQAVHAAGLQFEVESTNAIAIGKACCRREPLWRYDANRWESLAEIQSRAGKRYASLEQTAAVFLRPLQGGVTTIDAFGYQEAIGQDHYAICCEGYEANDLAVVTNPDNSSIGETPAENQRMRKLTVRMRGWRPEPEWDENPPGLLAAVERFRSNGGEWDRVEWTAVDADPHTDNTYRPPAMDQSVTIFEEGDQDEEDGPPYVRVDATDICMAIGIVRGGRVVTDPVTYPLVLVGGGPDYREQANVGRGWGYLEERDEIGWVFAISARFILTIETEDGELETVEGKARHSVAGSLSRSQLADLFAGQEVDLTERGGQGIRFTIQAVG